MAGGSRFVIACLAGLVILSAIPYSNAETVDSTNISIQMNQVEDAYVIGDELIITPKLFNPSETTTIDNNPSCDYIYKIYDENNVLTFSSEDNCRNQIQSIELQQGQQIDLMTQTWDFKDNDMNSVPTGIYSIQIIHSTLEISDSTTFKFLGNSSITEAIELRYNLVDLPSEFGTSYLLQAYVHNPLSESLTVTDLNCAIIVESDVKREIFDDCLKGTEVLHPHENIYSVSQIIDASWFNETTDLSIALVGDYQSKDIQIPEFVKTNQHNQLSDAQILDITYQLNDASDNPYLTLSAGYNQISNTAQRCIIDVFIIDDFGEMVLRESVDFCVVSESAVETPSGQLVVDLLDWHLTEQNGCMIDYGKYTIVVGDDNLHTREFFQNVPNVAQECINENLRFELSNEIVNNHLYTTLEIDNNEDLRIVAECLMVVDIIIDGAIEYNPTIQFCDYNSGNFLSLSDGKYLIQEKIDLPDFDTAEAISITHKISLEYTTIFVEDINILTEEEIIAQPTYIVSGVWDQISYNNRNCWMISSSDSGYILDDNIQFEQWMPVKDWSGEYRVAEQPIDSNPCAQLGLPLISITEIITENDPNEVQNGLADEDNDEAIALTEIAVYGVASSSILLGLVIFVSNTEGLRIPVTSAGLWLFALIGKTHETSDGRFQRGRLIGYLTANPGCHFRALMAALKMSNGQITHHLRLLENQELIWRINDGRFVRYYPLNNSLYPGMNPDDLPIPPLSPDPKSLQGKILTLLDDEHQLGEFPTQSELAKKLEKSQQLISHHLRTLQKYGLVEKRKMGIKNRYKLTKEALFLLETDLEYIRVRE